MPRLVSGKKQEPILQPTGNHSPDESFLWILIEIKAPQERVPWSNSPSHTVMFHRIYSVSLFIWGQISRNIIQNTVPSSKEYIRNLKRVSSVLYLWTFKRQINLDTVSQLNYSWLNVMCESYSHFGFWIVYLFIWVFTMLARQTCPYECLIPLFNPVNLWLQRWSNQFCGLIICCVKKYFLLSGLNSPLSISI